MTATILDPIEKRFACHDFGPDTPVTDDALESILEAGRLAPSAMGLEPWRFVVATKPDARAAIAKACFDQPAAKTAAALVVIVALVDALDPDSDYVRKRFEAEARGGDTDQIYEAYRGLYDPDTIEAWSQGQCHFAAAHMLLQATHLGLGSCPIGGFDPEKLSEAIALPSGESPALVIALGQCKEAPPERLRKPSAKTVSDV